MFYNFFFLIFYVGFCNRVLSQGKENNFSKTREDFEKVVENWDTKYSKELSNINGVVQYCHDKKYHEEIEKVLIFIHRYDSMLFVKLKEKYNSEPDEKTKKILQEIKKVQKEYGARHFMRKLKKECSLKREVDRDQKNNDIGENSADEEEILLELELKKYMKHITKSIDHLKTHIQYLEY